MAPQKFTICLGDEQARVCAEDAQPDGPGACLRHLHPGCPALPFQGKERCRRRNSKLLF